MRFRSIYCTCFISHLHLALRKLRLPVLYKLLQFHDWEDRNKRFPVQELRNRQINFISGWCARGSLNERGKASSEERFLCDDFLYDFLLLTDVNGERVNQSRRFRIENTNSAHSQLMHSFTFVERSHNKSLVVSFAILVAVARFYRSLAFSLFWFMFFSYGALKIPQCVLLISWRPNEYDRTKQKKRLREPQTEQSDRTICQNNCSL